MTLTYYETVQTPIERSLLKALVTFLSCDFRELVETDIPYINFFFYYNSEVHLEAKHVLDQSLNARRWNWYQSCQLHPGKKTSKHISQKRSMSRNENGINNAQQRTTNQSKSYFFLHQYEVSSWSLMQKSFIYSYEVSWLKGGIISIITQLTEKVMTLLITQQ